MALWRRLATLGLVFVLLSCSAIWWLPGRTVAIVVLPGASELSVQWRGTTAIVRYRHGGEPFGWRGQLARQLEREGWQGRSFTNMGAKRPPFVTIWYTRKRSFGPFGVVERAVFGGTADTPTIAEVELTRELLLLR